MPTINCSIFLLVSLFDTAQMILVVNHITSNEWYQFKWTGGIKSAKKIYILNTQVSSCPLFCDMRLSSRPFLDIRDGRGNVDLAKCPLLFYALRVQNPFSVSPGLQIKKNPLVHWSWLKDKRTSRPKPRRTPGCNPALI